MLIFKIFQFFFKKWKKRARKYALKDKLQLKDILVIFQVTMENLCFWAIK